MPVVKTSINLKVVGGPAMVVNAGSEVEAYDVIDVLVPPDTTDMVVDVQPAAAESVELMLVQCDRYDGKISYVASDGTDDSARIKLLGPQLYSGGMVALFDTDAKRLKFSNAHPAPAAGAAPMTARVQVVVGRRATVTP